MAAAVFAGAVVVTAARPSYADDAVPGAPTNVQIEQMDSGLDLTYMPGPNDGSPVASVTASCTSSDGGTAGTSTSTDIRGYIGGYVQVRPLTLGKHYTCTAHVTNGAGDGPESDVSNEIQIARAPDTPTHLVAVSADHKVTYSFDTPFDGGDPITKYVLTCDRMGPVWGQLLTVTGPASPLTVDNLQNGQPISCRVQAYNLIGSNVSTQSVTGYPNSIPSAPAIGAVTLVSNGPAISVAFTADYFNTLNVLSNTATCTSSDGGTTRSTAVAAILGSPIVVPYVTMQHHYMCTVHASNDLGDSAESAPSADILTDIVPHAPVVAAVSPGDGELSVSFSPGPDDGSLVTSYTASCASGNGGVGGNTIGSSSPLVVAGLTNAKSYTCTVYATNARGDSADSTPSNLSVPDVPADAPTIDAAAMAGTTAAVAFYPAPPNGGTPVSNFSATCTSTDGGITRAGTGTASPVSVANLSPGKHYSCVASALNGIGAGATSDPTQVVLVATPPSAPRGVKAVPGSASSATGSFLVSFGVPASNGGESIAKYTAVCSSSNGGVTKSSVRLSATPAAITVAGVSTRKSYRCTVQASNVVGASAASSPSPVLIVGAPSPPSAVKSVRVSAGRLRVTFTIGANNGSAITQQTATCTSANGGVSRTAVHVGATAAPIVVSALTPGKTYVCAVYSTNARGGGPVSAASSAAVA